MAWQRYTGKIEGDYPFDGHSIESQIVTPSNVEDRPGPIDNSDIVVNGVDNKDDDPQLLRTLEEGRHYVLVPEDVWDKLLMWYLFYWISSCISIFQQITTNIFKGQFMLRGPFSTVIEIP